MGGLSWWTLFEYLILAFIFAIFAGSIGTFSSAVCKKSIPAIILSYVIYGIIYGATYIPVFLVSILTDLDDFVLVFLVELTNPLHAFIVFFLEKVSGEDIMHELVSYNNYPSFVEWLFSSNVWIVISCIFQLGIAAFFIWLASNRIRPGKK